MIEFHAHTKAEALGYLGDMDWPKSGINIKITRASNSRTARQNRALHVFFTLLAEQLNDAGLDQKRVIKAMREGLPIPWTAESVKESLWKPLQSAMLNKGSTTELTTTEPSDVHERLSLWFIETFNGFLCPEWPHKKRKPPLTYEPNQEKVA